MKVIGLSRNNLSRGKAPDRTMMRILNLNPNGRPPEVSPKGSRDACRAQDSGIGSTDYQSPNRAAAEFELGSMSPTAH